MARELIQNTEQRIEEQSKSKWDKTIDHLAEYWYLYTCFGLALIAAVFFMVHRYYSATEIIDGSLWGQYGDFVGGVIGTLVSVLSVYYLIKTLKEQQLANKKVAENNDEIAKVYKLQQFDSNFSVLYKMYKSTLELYKSDSKEGREALMDMSKKLFEEFEPLSTYADTKKEAQQKFDEKFYIPKRDVAAVHFRTLFRLFDLIHNSPIEESKKVLYAKMLRSQLCEEELLLLRYNCHCHYGAEMRKYVNIYNLLKHLPLMSLGEFRAWRTFLNDENAINRIDTEFIALRKHIFNVIKATSPILKTKQIHYSPRYNMVITAATDNKSVELCLTFGNEKSKVTDTASIDGTFDKFTKDQLQNLFSDFLYELFVYSNFAEYNKPEVVNIEKSATEHTSSKQTSVRLVVTKNNYPLTLSYDKLYTPAKK